MSKISMNISLLTVMFILSGFALLYDSLSMSWIRYVAVMFTVSFFFLPFVVVFNALLTCIRSFRIHPVSGWMLLLIAIILTSHFFISFFILILHIHPVSAELVWLLLNTSMLLALLIRIRSIQDLLKSFYHEEDSTYSIG